jgi:uncharacterized protein YeeX (DUF496 family)
MDFSGFGLEDDLIAKLEAAYEESVSGLKSKNAELVAREKALKEKLKESDQEKITALEEAENLKVEQAEKAGDVEKFKLAIEQRDNAIAALKQEFQDRENDRLISETTGDFLKHVADNDAARFYMEHKFKESIQVIDGQVRPKDASMTLDTLTEKFTTGEEYKSYIKANVGSGAGSAGSNGSSFGGKKFSEMTATEKAIFANQNPDQYAQHMGAN